MQEFIMEFSIEKCINFTLEFIISAFCSFIYKPPNDGPCDWNMYWLNETIKLIKPSICKIWSFHVAEADNISRVSWLKLSTFQGPSLSPSSGFDVMMKTEMVSETSVIWTNWHG
jgi:hypothetical protein